MSHKRFTLLTLSVVTVMVGCSTVGEVGKTFWGSSTRALERARDKADRASFSCRPQECLDAVLVLTKPSVTLGHGKEAVSAGSGDGVGQDTDDRYHLFLLDRRRFIVVVMGVPGQVDTTEVGLFFDRVTDGKTKIEVSSLSSSAKARVSEHVFAELANQFGQVAEE